MMGDNFDMLRRALDLPVDADVETVCEKALLAIDTMVAHIIAIAAELAEPSTASRH